MAEPALEALQYAVTLHQSGDFSEAERQYRRAIDLCTRPGAAIEQEPVLAQARHNLGLLAVHVGQPALGLSYLKAAVAAQPARADYWVAQAQSLLGSGRVSDAVACLERGRKESGGGQQLDEMLELAKQKQQSLAVVAGDVLSMFGPYVPGSAGSGLQRLELAIAGANRVPALLSQLAMGDDWAIAADVELLERLSTDHAGRAAVEKLAELFNLYGSDKATIHNYHELYGAILREPASIKAVLEVGIGTNNEDVVSNMSRTGRPGASLRAFRDFLPHANVFGADVDKRILFSEERIATFHVDQTDPATFDELSRQLPDDMDLIIDDGLHSPDANLSTLLFALRKIRRGGWFIVEDIMGSAAPLWRVVAALLPASYGSRLFKGRVSHVFAVQRLHEDCATSLSIVPNVEMRISCGV